jgi:uncharacterized protein YkvS
MGDKDYSGIYNNFEVKGVQEQRVSDFVILRKQKDSSYTEQGSSYTVTLGDRDVVNTSEITYGDTALTWTSKEIQTRIDDLTLTPVDDKVYLAYYPSSRTYLLNGKNTFYVFKNIPEEQKYEVYTYILGDKDAPKSNKKTEKKEYEEAYRMMQGGVFQITDNSIVVDVTLGILSDLSQDEKKVYISGDGKSYKITRNDDNRKDNETKFEKTDQSNKVGKEIIDIIEYFEFVKHPDTKVATKLDKLTGAVKQGFLAVSDVFKRATGGKKSRRKTKTIKKRVKKTRRKR